MSFALASYDYLLPSHLIATHPIYPREDARLLVYKRSNSHITHTTFANLLDFIPKQSIIILNNTRVLKARLIMTKLPRNSLNTCDINTISNLASHITSSLHNALPKVTRELLFHRFLTRTELDVLPLESSSIKPFITPSDMSGDTTSLVLCQIKGRVNIGDVLMCGRFCAIILHRLEAYYIMRFAIYPSAFSSSKLHALSRHDVLAMLEEIGYMPLPPYIRKKAHEERANKPHSTTSVLKPFDTPPLDASSISHSNSTISHESYARDDERDYQSIFATKQGSIAAPTASLHISPAMLKAFGDAIAYVTLHIGAGTFASVKTSDIREHRMHAEWLHISAHELARIIHAPSRLCIGTSALRSVEYALRLLASNPHANPHSDMYAQCDAFFHIGDPPRFCEYLLTNFHLPKSTLAMLVASMVGLTQWRRIYTEAITKQYRFYSYGDGMLIL